MIKEGIPLMPAVASSLTLGQVTENDDPARRGCVKVRLSALEVELWAQVVTASAGAGFGVQMLPRIGETVVVAFITPEFALVLGSLWVGSRPMPDDAAPVNRRYCITSPAGTVMVFDDEEGPRLEVTTPAGNRLLLSDAGGGEGTVEIQGTRVTLTPAKVEVRTSGEVDVQALGQVQISAAQVSVNASLSQFSGVVQCPTLQASTVIAATYSPGAGNVW